MLGDKAIGLHEGDNAFKRTAPQEKREKREEKDSASAEKGRFLRKVAVIRKSPQGGREVLPVGVTVTTEQAARVIKNAPRGALLRVDNTGNVRDV